MRKIIPPGLSLLLSLVCSTANAAGVPLPPGSTTPKWPTPFPAPLTPDSVSLRNNKLKMFLTPDVLGGYQFNVENKLMAIAQNHPMIGYVHDGQLRWMDLAEAAKKRMTITTTEDSHEVRYEAQDADGGNWLFNQVFKVNNKLSSGIDIRTEITCDQDRSVAFLPMFVIFPGVGSFAAVKNQGLLAGLEYLENEPSSSEADIVGPASKRQVPDNLKLTFPLMAIQNDGRFLALTWKMSNQFCALYDSPDRIFGTVGHVMGVLFPGSDGKNRKEGSLLPSATETLSAGKPVVLEATLIGGLGNSVVPAIQQYLTLNPLPNLPATLKFQEYATEAAEGWLDSKIHQGQLFRHAVADGNFAPGPAADAAVWMDWLASQTENKELANRLHDTASNALSAVSPADYNASGVGHVRYPVGSLIYGHVAENLVHAEERGRALLAGFEPDLSMHYHPRPGGPDYAKTHSSNEANGFTSRPVEDLLEAAAFSGDPDLLTAALKVLRAMSKFHNAVPRGAQTWECPLHIPDILASAQMVRAYTLGYELTGETEFLDEARYWAWTGVPFVYLVNPTSEPVGPYATIAVFGATQWKAPVWLGLPVQWCGLVYSDALYRLLRHDPTGPWKKLADGIAASGVQQSWPTTDQAMQGLLPDSFVLRSQHRNGPAINPATLLASASRFYGRPPVYDFWCSPTNRVRVHAPGLIKGTEVKTGVSFQIESWVNHPYYILINGLTKKPQLKINGQSTDLSAPHDFQEKPGRLILKVEGKPRIELNL